MTSHDTTVLLTNRLVLTPLEPSDAFEMVDVLADSALYTFTGGEPPGFAQLDERYKSQVAGPSDPVAQWHNWIIRIADSHSAAGFVQATVTNDHADVAWVVGMHWQHNGIAREATIAMCRWLRTRGIRRITAHIHPDHDASARVARACGLQPTGEVDDDGEVVWIS